MQSLQGALQTPPFPPPHRYRPVGRGASEGQGLAAPPTLAIGPAEPPPAFALHIGPGLPDLGERAWVVRGDLSPVAGPTTYWQALARPESRALASRAEPPPHLIAPQVQGAVISILEAAATAGEPERFTAVCKTTDWSRRPAVDFERASKLALAAGAFLAARRLAEEGVRYNPSSGELQKLLVVLSPPKAVRADLPPDSTLRANRDWLKQHASDYRGQWVGLRGGQLIGHASTLKALVSQIADRRHVLLAYLD